VEETIGAGEIDEAWLIATLLGISCLVLAFRNEGKIDRASIILAVCFFGFSTITRSVVIPLLMGTIVFALFALVLILSKFRSKNLKRDLDHLADIAGEVLPQV